MTAFRILMVIVNLGLGVLNLMAYQSNNDIRYCIIGFFGILIALVTTFRILSRAPLID